MLRVQINTGLVPVQDALAQEWHAASPVPLRPGGDEQTWQVADMDAETAIAVCPNTSTSPLSTLLAALQTFERCPEYPTVPQPIQTLTLALAQHVQLALRDALSVTQTQSLINLSLHIHEGAKNNG